MTDTIADLEAETLGYTVSDVDAEALFGTLADTLRETDGDTNGIELASTAFCRGTCPYGDLQASRSRG